LVKVLSSFLRHLDVNRVMRGSGDDEGVNTVRTAHSQGNGTY